MLRSQIQKHVKKKIRKRWLLFNAKDFQSLMYPCFIFGHISGIFPYKINTSTFEISKPHCILSTMIICVYCVFYLVLIHSIIISGTITYGDVPRDLEAVGYFTLTGLAVIATHLWSVPRMGLLQTILEISSKLSLKSYQKLSRFIHLKDILCTILLIVQMSMYFSKEQALEVNCFTILIMAYDMYLALVMLHMNMLYINCVCILTACFKEINNNLMHMKGTLINNMELSISSLMCHVQRDQFFLIKLKTVMQQHLIITRTVQMLNTIFGLQLLATIFGFFSEFTFELYFYVVHWQQKLHFSIDWHFLDVFVIQVAHYSAKIMLLVWACETGKTEAQKISTTIYDVLNSTSDKQIKAELHTFSLQILHCKNTFSAKGLTVDATLLTAILGSVTTHMLILIQFLITTHSCDEKSGSNITINSVT
ncbi:PREDICTED: putative gustatory receptor 28b isoform X1 [Vollenhovia emeryi]|uniref:putative gustatory receptor 28b isoform X1 n=1 Tax=Vollenhovia emeryi TaxID=411798 RepID=UPI0005F3F47D|nr:PREDICTED: putative gustatory receptor 28b isoform X1 [Vollenhovia emeryi]XP_011880402.1 PREDICTED: putative gustatory receptor 28b isoform X1 [Vollenhovia emeryi]